jgi:LAS superfamily LD-carboxypeptidase LdcB
MGIARRRFIMTKTLNAAQIKVIADTVEADFVMDKASTTLEERIAKLAALPEALATPKLAELVAKKHGTTMVSRVADRGPSVGQTVFVFGSGKYDEDNVADAARKALSRIRAKAWPKVAKAADKDAAEELLKALERVVKGRAKLSVADRKKFAKLAAGVGVSFV